MKPAGRSTSARRPAPKRCSRSGGSIRECFQRILLPMAPSSSTPTHRLLVAINGLPWRNVGPIPVLATQACMQRLISLHLFRRRRRGRIIGRGRRFLAPKRATLRAAASRTEVSAASTYSAATPSTLLPFTPFLLPTSLSQEGPAAGRTLTLAVSSLAWAASCRSAANGTLIGTHAQRHNERRQSGLIAARTCGMNSKWDNGLPVEEFAHEYLPLRFRS